jgi:hypothetical protein
VAKAQTHQAVEFQVAPHIVVDEDAGVEAVVEPVAYRKFYDAVKAAAGESALAEGEPMRIDVVATSRAGAEWWGGKVGAQRYRDNPDAKALERVVLSARLMGVVR